MQNIIDQLIQEIRKAALQEARKEIIREIANGQPVDPAPAPIQASQKQKRSPGPEPAKILSCLPASSGEIAQKLGETRSRVSTALAALKKRGLVHPVGKTKSAVWHPNNPKPHTVKMPYIPTIG